MTLGAPSQHCARDHRLDEDRLKARSCKKRLFCYYSHPQLTDSRMNYITILTYLQIMHTLACPPIPARPYISVSAGKLIILVTLSSSINFGRHSFLDRLYRRMLYGARWTFSDRRVLFRARGAFYCQCLLWLLQSRTAFGAVRLRLRLRSSYFVYILLGIVISGAQEV